jgi:hypothetical protein
MWLDNQNAWLVLLVFAVVNLSGAHCKVTHVIGLSADSFLLTYDVVQLPFASC